MDSLQVLRGNAAADTSQVIATLVSVTPEVSSVVLTPITPSRAPAAPPALAPSLETTQPALAPMPEQNSVRVALGKLDALLTESGELSVTHLRIAERLNDLRGLQRQLERWQRDWSKTRPARSRLRRAHAQNGARDGDALVRFADQSDHVIQSILQDARALVGDLSQNTAQLGAVADAISQEVLAIRLLPAGTVFMPLERLVRDLARQTGKDARLVLSGTDTEIDRRILDELRDPLMHMVRNTVDHGLELPQDRVQANKTSHGTLHLAAVQRGDRVQITVEDDGRGLDVDAIRETAIRRNLLTAERADQMDVSNLIDLIFHPGFSTRTSVTEISGRGVGMDVVREHVRRLGGEIAVRTTPGAGTCFTITVPLTLATTRVMLVEDGGQLYAVPSSNIERTGRMRMSDMLRLEGRRALQLDGRPIPVVELSEVLQRGDVDRSAASEEWRPYFVLPQGDRAIALLADRLIDETELVVKSLGAPLKRVRHVGGAAILGTGAVVVILNPADLIKSALGTLEASPRVSAHEVAAPEAAAPRRRVLVVDDSVMTRTLERTILESAGYTVFVAADGAQALALLDETTVDAIVSDVEMPGMTGLELTAAVRQDERWRHLPIVLVTSLDSPEHVERGAAAGADAYIVKGRFDQNDLLQTVGRLL
jgi:two-component system chemotaxis sensor kinase CheA